MVLAIAANCKPKMPSMPSLSVKGFPVLAIDSAEELGKYEPTQLEYSVYEEMTEAAGQAQLEMPGNEIGGFQKAQRKMHALEQKLILPVGKKHGLNSQAARLFWFKMNEIEALEMQLKEDE